jgi:hypothetical protein
MADRGDAQISKVVGCQIGQQFHIDVILTECRLVLAQTERLQPLPNIHRRNLRISDVRDDYLSADCLSPGRASRTERAHYRRPVAFRG